MFAFSSQVTFHNIFSAAEEKDKYAALNEYFALENCEFLKDVSMHVRQSHVEIKDYSVAYFNRILCTCTQGFAPPLFHKYSFRPPLDQFLNEGLVCAGHETSVGPFSAPLGLSGAPLG